MPRGVYFLRGSLLVAMEEGDRKSSKRSKDGLNWGRGNGTEERTRRKMLSPRRWAP